MGTERQQYAWALEYVADQICYEPTPPPKPFERIDRITEWNEKIALEACTYDIMGKTNKGSTATVCKGKEDYQYRLDRSLANRMYLRCQGWCVYDIFTIAEEVFIWRNGDEEKCWDPVTSGLCIQTLWKDQDVM